MQCNFQNPNKTQTNKKVWIWNSDVRNDLDQYKPKPENKKIICVLHVSGL